MILVKKDGNYNTLIFVKLILNKLFEHNAPPDPDNAPKMDEKTKRPNWGYYPIIFDV